MTLSLWGFCSYADEASTPTATVRLTDGSSFGEGDTISVEVVLYPAPKSSLNVVFELVSDDNVDTDDADSNDFAIGTSGNVEVDTNGKGTIEIVSADDHEIERADGEYFQLRLRESSISAYSLGSPSSVTLNITEGVCDRTSQIRDRLVSRLQANCADIRDADLEAVSQFATGRLSTLHERDLWGLSNLWRLHLCGDEASEYSQRGELNELPQDLLTQVPGLSRSLYQLVIDGCSISELPSEFLTDLEGLSELLLSEPLISLPAFPRYGQLSQLTLDQLEITTLPDQAFADTGIEALYIQKTPKLSSVHPGAFEGLPVLRGLSVSWTAIHELPSKVFTNLHQLRWLQLAYAELSSIDSVEFPSGLAFLSLNNNALRTLPSDLGSRLVNLEDLRVEYQNSDAPFALVNGAFTGMTKLKSLQLAHNQMAELPKGIFRGLDNLRRMRLNHNQLNSLPDGLFHTLPQIQLIDVRGNPGAPFPIVFDLDREDDRDDYDGPAHVTVSSKLGWPTDITIGLATFNAKADKDQITINRSDLKSEVIVVDSVGEDAGHVSLGPIMNAQASYDAVLNGFILQVGAPLVLFESSSNHMPNSEVAISSRKLQVNGAAWEANMGGCFRDFDQQSLTFSATSDDEEIVRVAYGEGGLLSFEPGQEGVATITVFATDSLGLHVAQDFEISVESKPDTTKFDIQFDFINFDEIPEEVNTAITNGARRWMEVIVGDLEEIPVVASPLCEDNSQPFTGNVDDIRIAVSPLNTISNAAGLGGFTGSRASSELPFLGHIQLRVTGDPEHLEKIALHEIGHALGFAPALWSRFGLFHNPSQRDGSGADTHFSGALAQSAFDEAGGTLFQSRSKVPLHNGGYINSDSHWPFGELMDVGATGVLSAITVQLLADLGYSVDVSKADSFVLPVDYHSSYRKLGDAPDHTARELTVGTFSVGTAVQGDSALPRQSIEIVDENGAIIEVLDARLQR